MSTTMVRKEDVVRKWYVLDAAGKPLGKTAALAADLLRGKRKVDYTPHVDCGDFVIIRRYRVRTCYRRDTHIRSLVIHIPH